MDAQRVPAIAVAAFLICSAVVSGGLWASQERQDSAANASTAGTSGEAATAPGVSPEATAALLAAGLTADDVTRLGPIANVMFVREQELFEARQADWGVSETLIRRLVEVEHGLGAEPAHQGTIESVLTFLLMSSSPSVSVTEDSLKWLRMQAYRTALPMATRGSPWDEAPEEPDLALAEGDPEELEPPPPRPVPTVEERAAFVICNHWLSTPGVLSVGDRLRTGLRYNLPGAMAPAYELLNSGNASPDDQLAVYALARFGGRPELEFLQSRLDDDRELITVGAGVRREHSCQLRDVALAGLIHMTGAGQPRDFGMLRIRRHQSLLFSELTAGFPSEEARAAGFDRWRAYVATHPLEQWERPASTMQLQP